MSRQLTHEDHRSGAGKYALCLLAHDMASPVNIGSLFRIADALGIEKIYLSGRSPVPPNPKIKKTSRSAEKYVAFEYYKHPDEVIASLKRDQYKIISLEITSNSEDIQNVHLAPHEKICLVLGSENSGVSDALLAASDVSVHIPMRGQKSSMNVANACAIACYVVTSQLSSIPP